MKYLNREALNNFNSQTVEYISLFSDWDLNATFLNPSSPFLAILLTPCKVNASKMSSSDTVGNSTYAEWDVIDAQDLKSFQTMLSHPQPVPRVAMVR